MISMKILTALVMFSALPLTAQDVVLITHPDTAEKEISSRDVQKIYLNRKNFWSDGSSIKAAAMKKGQVHQQFLSDFVKKSSQQYSTYWKRIIFTGKGSPPRSFNNVAELVAYVAATPGAVGYAPREANLDGVKVVEIQ